MAEFKLPDPKKNAGRFMGLVSLAGVGLLAWYYLVPFLVTMVWNTVSLAIGAIIAGIVLMVLLSKKFWKRLNIIMQALGSMLFSWLVEMNPFAILELHLNKSEEDREVLREQIQRLEAQRASLKQQLDTENEALVLSAQKVKMCKDKLRSNPADEQTGYDLESSTIDYNNSKDFIDKVGPIAKDIDRLVTFAEKAYRKSGHALKNARSTVQKQRAAYEAVSAGSSAMSKALRAFSGDPEMNNAKDIALNKLRNDIADKIGTIRNCITETSRIMNEQDLNDAAKVQLAANNIEQLNVDEKFDYVASIEGTGHIPQPVPANRWLDSLKK